MTDTGSRIAKCWAAGAIISLALFIGPLLGSAAAQDENANDTRFLAGPNAATMNAITPELLRTVTMLQLMGLGFRFDILSLNNSQIGGAQGTTEYAAAQGVVLSDASGAGGGDT
jgi:hypothetical protein